MSNLTPTPTPPDLEKESFLAKQCNRYENGECRTLRCVKRGGWDGKTVLKDTSIATCEPHEILTELSQLRAENERLKAERDKHNGDANWYCAALHRIKDHSFTSYEAARDGIYEGQYGIGVVDGHRACAQIARETLKQVARTVLSGSAE